MACYEHRAVSQYSRYPAGPRSPYPCRPLTLTPARGGISSLQLFPSSLQELTGKWWNGILSRKSQDSVIYRLTWQGGDVERVESDARRAPGRQVHWLEVEDGDQTILNPNTGVHRNTHTHVQASEKPCSTQQHLPVVTV